MKINKYMLFAAMGCMVMAACGDDDNWQPGAPDAEGKAGAYFPTITSEIEVEPTDPTEIEFTVARTNTDGALQMPLEVLSNDDDVFQIPATANFADGETQATVKVTYADAEPGVTYSFEVKVPEDYITTYKPQPEGGVSYKFTVTRIKWESLGTCYFVEGIIPSLFGLSDPTPLAVTVEKATTATDVRFRFDSPFAYVSTGNDGLGYIGYPYNEEGDCDNEKHVVLIKVTEQGAFIQDTEMGMNWGYGSMSFGTIYGNLSENIDSYPLGTYSEAGQTITFPENSLYTNLPETESAGSYPNSMPSVLYLSAEAYQASLGQ